MRYDAAVRAVVCSAWSILLTACGGQAASAEAPSSSVEAPAPPQTSGKRPPCKLGEDQACNDDPKVSALWGRCTEAGACECNAGFALTPWGRCAPAK
jgi:hypothetical protein